MDCEGGVCQLRPTGGKPLSIQPYEVGPDFAMLEWAPREGFERFEVQIKEENGWRTLSDKLATSFVRKKNLAGGGVYAFRVRGYRDGAWTEFSPDCSVKTTKSPLAAAPIVRSFVAQEDGNHAALVEWQSQPGAERYHVQMRRMQANELTWVTLSDKLSGTALRKKNLPSAPDYVFRVRACLSDGSWGDWTAVSSAAKTATLAPCFKNLLGSNAKLVRGTTKESVGVERLAGKTIGVLFSGPSWCPPCRQQDTMMKQQYPAIRAKGLPFEVVFVSADRDEDSFNQYFSSMPWLAMPWNSNRQQVQAMYKVTGVPKLMIFSPSGALVLDNAAGMPLTEQLVASWTEKA